MFNFRKKDANAPLPPASGPVDTIDALRKRARHRLIGSAILVVLGFSAFALLFDTQPRAIAIDIPIEIPDKLTIKPLVMPALSAPAAEMTPTVAAPPAASPAPKVSAIPVAPAVSATPPSTQTTNSAETIKTVAPQESKPSAAAVAPPVAKTPVSNNEIDKAKRAESDRAKALLEGGAVAKQPENERFIVQFGAFSDAGKARETRQIVEKSGLKTYAQEATVDGAKRIRVRVGPFATRAEAEKAATTIKALGLPAAILTL